MENENIQNFEEMQRQIAEIVKAINERAKGDEEISKNLSEITKRIEEMQGTLEDNAKSVSIAVDEAKNARKEVHTLSQKIDTMNATIEELTVKNNTLTKRLTDQDEMLKEMSNDIKVSKDALSAANSDIRALSIVQMSEIKSQDFDKNAHIMENVIKEECEAHGAMVFILDAEKDSLYRVNEFGQREYCPDNGNVFNDVFAQGEAIICKNINEVNELSFKGMYDAQRTDNCVIAPLKNAKNETYGVAFIENTDAVIDQNLINKLDLNKSSRALAKELAIYAANEVTRKYQNIDKLTGIYDKLTCDAVQSYIKGDVYNLLQSEKPVSVIYADIDHFKKFNDTYGHDVGDKVLRQVAQTIKASVRGEDCVVRLHGEEMAVIVPANIDVAASLAERINNRVAETPLDIGDKNVGITISVGVAKVNPSILIDASRENFVERFEKIALKSADMQLYRAKENGRNGVAVQNKPYTPKDYYISEFEAKNDIMLAKPPYIYDNGETLLNMNVKDKDGYVAEVSIKAVGEISVQYCGETYDKPSEFPAELREAILTRDFSRADISANNALDVNVKVYNNEGEEIYRGIPNTVSWDLTEETLESFKETLVKHGIEFINAGKGIERDDKSGEFNKESKSPKHEKNQSDYER